jgi:hypothetical protein
MTTLALDNPRAFELGEENDFPMIDNDIIYQGAAVGLVDASGHARPITSADKFVGFALANADNTGAGHVAAAINVHVRKKGSVKLAITGAVITDVGLPVYAQDDNAFSFIPTSGVFVGLMRRFVSAGYGVVEFNAGVLRDPHAGLKAETKSANYTIDAEDSGKIICVDTDAVVITLPAVSGIANIRIMNVAAFGAALVEVAPNSADMIEGPDITAADDKSMFNTKATARRGDYIDLEYGDSNGWTITRMSGTWARE